MTSCRGGNDMTPKTAAIGAALAVAGVLLGMNYPIAEAQPDGPYALSAGGANFVWRMNTRTGEVSLCGVAGPQAVYANMETAEGEADRRFLMTPKCSPWAPAAR